MLHLKKHRSTLVQCLKFDSNWIAGEMNAIGLLSDSHYEEITNIKSVHGLNDKAEMMVNSLEIKVDINSKHLKTFADLLKKKARIFSDAIDILEGKVWLTDQIELKCICVEFCLAS